KCRACLAPYKLTCPQCFATRGGRGGYACPPSLSLRRGGRGAVAKATANIFCFLKKLSNTLPWKVHRNQWVRNLSSKFSWRLNCG
ncbi:MAG: hypothetical protein KKH45_05230, partial [Proteobacteria bacterium]|nr:hypothetical protein [Pseudomonadota bacterium]